MNNQFPSKETVQRLRERYPEGTRIELISMDDPYSKLKPGDKGTVSQIDSTGTIFCKWDSGSGLGLVYGADQYKKIEAAPAKDAPRYATGADFWRDTAVSYGRQEALSICGRYLDTQLKIEQPTEEHRFCRELFTAMYEDAAKTVDPAKLVYPYDLPRANERTERTYYRDSMDKNGECARAIDAAINASCYKADFYNLNIAAMKSVHDYGFERVNMVLAKHIQDHHYDGRLSNANKQWATGYDVPARAFADAGLNSHAILVDGFATHTRKLYEELGAERFALPGRPESGEAVHGYEIVRAVEFNDQRGFAIGLNPDAVDQFVTWQFTTENGARDYYWGNYSDEFADAALNYIARIIVHTSGGDVQEKQRALEFEKSTEQNYNMIDGARNNEGVPKPDLTDGQTYEEIRELAPETLPQPEVNESEQNFAAWMAVTESSRYKWVEDEIYRLNGRGAFYYTGGEDGIYMRIQKDGTLEAGNYEGAIPHIGEAMFTAAVVKSYASFSEAYKAAMEAGGKQFMVDMFSGSERQPLTKITGKDAPEDKPSVLEQIREARSTPKPPAKPKPELGKKKDGPEL